MSGRGFSLIEMVVVLLLLGVLGLSAVLAVMPVTRGLLMTRDSVSATQKSHLALIRLVREFSVITNVISGASTTFVYEFADHADVAHQRNVSWSDGGALLLDGVPLTDDVGHFTLQYYETPGGTPQNSWGTDMRMVEIILQPNSFRSVVYTNRVYLRHLE